MPKIDDPEDLLRRARRTWEQIGQGRIDQVQYIIMYIYGYNVPMGDIPISSEDLGIALVRYGELARMQVCDALFIEVLAEIWRKVKDRRNPFTWESFGLNEAEVATWIRDQAQAWYVEMLEHPDPSRALMILDLPYFSGQRWDEALGAGATLVLRDNALGWCEAEYAALQERGPSTNVDAKRAKLFWDYIYSRYCIESMIIEEGAEDGPVDQIYRGLSFNLDEAESVCEYWEDLAES